MRRAWIVVPGFWLALAGAPALAAEGYAAGAPGGPAYVRMSPIAFSVIGPSNRIDKEVSVTVALELEQGKTEQMFEVYRRSVIDAFLVTLTAIYEDEHPDDPVDSDDLKQRLLDTANQVAGKGLVHSVLLISLGERKRR